VLFVLPFMALVATCGARALIESPRWTRRALGAALLVAIPLQFASFYRDYMGDYRARSAFWFEYNVQGALASAIRAADERGARLAIQGNITMIDWQWRYSLLKHDRPELRARSAYFTAKAATPDTFPPGTVIVADADTRQRLAALPLALEEIDRMREPDGAISYYVLFRR